MAVTATLQETGRNSYARLVVRCLFACKGPLLLLRTLAAALIHRVNFDYSKRSQTRALAPGGPADPGFVSVFVKTHDRLKLHVRIYGSRTSALPVVCLPGLARTAADFHSLAVALATDPAQPRWVVAPDYRGHGQSEYDRNPDNYAVGVDLADVSAVLTALTIPPAILVGTSHGGVLAMMLAQARPNAIAGVILNDIGPVVELQGLLQIKAYVGKLPIPRDFAEGAEILRWLLGKKFPKLTPQDWLALAQRTWREQGRGLVPDYDVGLARTLEMNWARSLSTLWDQFDALARVPLMVIRGANSQMLTSATLQAMLARRADVEVAVVPDQGHAPLLTEPKLIRRIAGFIASCNDSNRTPRSPSGPTDRPGVAPELCRD
jgi:pimeloyl-ACP methyl ester carboxylesterase